MLRAILKPLIWKSLDMARNVRFDVFRTGLGVFKADYFGTLSLFSFQIFGLKDR